MFSNSPPKRTVCFPRSQDLPQASAHTHLLPVKFLDQSCLWQSELEAAITPEWRQQSTAFTEGQAQQTALHFGEQRYIPFTQGAVNCFTGKLTFLQQDSTLCHIAHLVVRLTTICSSQMEAPSRSSPPQPALPPAPPSPPSSSQAESREALSGECI